MTSERDFDRLARAWLELGPDEAPDRVVAAVLQAAQTTPQVRRRIRLPFRRSFEMNRYPIAVGATAVLVAVIGGAILLNQPGQGGVGGPGGGSSAAPSASATLRPTPSPATSSSAAVEPVTLGIANLDQPMVSGTYRVAAPFNVPFSMTVPLGWSLKSLAEGDVTFLNTAVNDGNGAAWISLDLVENVFADPCHTEGGPIKPPVPSTVDGVVTALTRMVGFSAGPVSDVVVGGYAGKVVELTNAINTDTAGCTGNAPGMLPMFTSRGGGRGATNGGPNDGAREHILVIDVAGTLVLIDRETFAETLDASIPVADTIIQSIAFN